MNVLKAEKKLAVLNTLLEGCSIGATVRMTGVHKKTIRFITAVASVVGKRLTYTGLTGKELPDTC